MSQVEVGGLTINYDVQGDGEPLLLIPYTSADHACYAFQLPAYTEHFRCIALDLPGLARATSRTGRTRRRATRSRSPAFLAAIGVEPRARGGSIARGGRGGCTWPRATRTLVALAVAAQRVGPQRRLT